MVDTAVDGRLLAPRRERALLVGIDGTSDSTEWPADLSLDELAQLAATAGAEVVGRTLLHVRRVAPATLIGRGQLEDVVALGRAHQADVLILDAELLPRQQRNFERGWNGKVVDRTGVILDIFASRANSVEGRLQVERAQLEYLLPRLSQLWVEFSRQRGGIGPFRGPGETQIETDRRLYRHRMVQIDRRLDAVRRQRRARRDRRRASGLLSAALVGYTNAGKSTLLNALSGASVRTENRLFATLDPTTRRVDLPGHGAVLVTDTVGFIQRLPTRLIKAFRATLEEAVDADVLVHVVDLTAADVQRQVAVVERTLDEIGVGPLPVLTALNKADRARSVDPEAFPNAVTISALTGAGLDVLLRRLAEYVQDRDVEIAVRIPYAAGDLVHRFHDCGTVTREAHDAGGTRIEGRLPRDLLPAYQEYRVDAE